VGEVHAGPSGRVQDVAVGTDPGEEAVHRQPPARVGGVDKVRAEALHQSGLLGEGLGSARWLIMRNPDTPMPSWRATISALGNTGAAGRWCSRSSALPRPARIAEVDREPGVTAQLGVLGHLRALVPGRGAAQPSRQRRDRGGDASRLFSSRRASSTRPDAESGEVRRRGEPAGHQCGVVGQGGHLEVLAGHRGGW